MFETWQRSWIVQPKSDPNLEKILPADFDEARVIAIPDDIVSLRTSDPDQAREWRMRVREQFLDALERDFSVVGLDSHGSYVLAKDSTS